MKIATFNINNVNKRLPNLLAWLRAAKPDVVCLQELRPHSAIFRQRRSRRPAMVPSGAGSHRGTALPFSGGIANR
jgi:exodeoxyribonuclease-3